MKHKAENVASDAADKARQAASTVSERAQSMASSASEMATNAGKKVTETVSQLGENIQSAAGSLRERGPHGGRLGDATSMVADRMDSAGRYLQEEGLSGIAEDVTTLIRRNPIPALFVGIGIGFLLARITRS
jgi:methyl-accepting chemotaxis protein